MFPGCVTLSIHIFVGVAGDACSVPSAAVWCFPALGSFGELAEVWLGCSVCVGQGEGLHEPAVNRGTASPWE